MQNRDKWRPSKFVYGAGGLHASRDTAELALSSRLNAEVTARHYDTYLRKYARGRLLDLGCGKVPLFEAYRDRVSDNVCVDWGNSLHKNEHLDLECDLTQPLPFAAGEFDTILLSDVLEHIAEPMSLWREMHRVLAADGTLILNVPFFYWLHEQPDDYYRYTEFALRRFVHSSDMTVIELKPTGGVPEIMADMIAKTSARVPFVGRAIAMAVQSLTLALVRTGIGSSLSARTAGRFPLGYFLVAAKRPATMVLA